MTESRFPMVHVRMTSDRPFADVQDAFERRLGRFKPDVYQRGGANCCPTSWPPMPGAVRMPKGVYSLVDGDGPTVGAAISGHPGIDMVSFTGSTRAGVDVAKRAADNVKRLHQELGRKSPNIVLDDADLAQAVTESGPRIVSIAVWLVKGDCQGVVTPQGCPL